MSGEIRLRQGSTVPAVARFRIIPSRLGHFEIDEFQERLFLAFPGGLVLQNSILDKREQVRIAAGLGWASFQRHVILNLLLKFGIGFHPAAHFRNVRFGPNQKRMRHVLHVCGRCREEEEESAERREEGGFHAGDNLSDF